MSCIGDLIEQGDVETFRQSSSLDVDAFIHTIFFKMHHFPIFSVMAGIKR